MRSVGSPEEEEPQQRPARLYDGADHQAERTHPKTSAGPESVHQQQTRIFSEAARQGDRQISEPDNLGTNAT